MYLYLNNAPHPVDKRNANLSEPDQESSSKPKLNVNPGLSPSVALGAPHSPTSAASAALLLLESCDGNRNDESRFHHLHSANAPPRPGKSINLCAVPNPQPPHFSLSSQFPLCIFN